MENKKIVVRYMSSLFYSSFVFTCLPMFAYLDGGVDPGNSLTAYPGKNEANPFAGELIIRGLQIRTHQHLEIQTEENL